MVTSLRFAVLRFFFCVTTLWACSLGVAIAGPLRLAPLPMENREATVKAFNPVVTYLQEALKVPVELVYFDKNSEIVAAMQHREVDVAMLGPLPYVSGRQRGVAMEPLVLFKEASGEARYRCTLVAFGGDTIALGALRGKRIALTQPLSTCGYFGTNAILRKQAGITLEDMRYRYVSTHEAAAQAVVSGEADVAGIKDEFAVKFATLGLVTLAFSDWVPALGLFANPATIDPKRIDEVRKILLATHPDVYKRWGNAMRYGMVPATDIDFASIRRLGDPASIPVPPESQ